jgi:hypothetical protein
MDYLMRLGASREELDRFPKYNLGRDKDPGVFRAVLKCFEPYYLNLLSALGEDRLRQIQTFDRFVELLRDSNDMWAKKSKDLHVQNQQAVPQQSINDTFAESHREKAQSKMAMGQKYNRAPMSDSNRSHGDGYGPARENHRYPDRRDLQSMNSDNADPRMDDRQQAFDNSRNRSENEPYFNYAGDDSNTDSQTEGFGCDYNYVGPSVRETPKKVNVCWKQFKHGKCDIPDCSFSHKDSDLRAHGERLLTEHRETTLNSPYVMRSNPMSSRGGSQSKPASGGSSTLSTVPQKKLWNINQQLWSTDTQTADIKDEQGRAKIDELASPTNNNPV